jgi:hypothetical protein
VDDLLKGKQIIVNGRREWNSIYVAAKRNWVRALCSRFRILNSRLSPQEDMGAKSDSSRPGMSISPEMTNLLALATAAKRAGVSLDSQMIFWLPRGKVSGSSRCKPERTRSWRKPSLKELEEIKTATASIPADRTYVCLRNTANHPLLLTGPKIPAGFGVHIWSHGYKRTGETEKEVDDILNGSPGWERYAKDLKADYVFWGKEEKERFPKSTIPWAKKPIKAKGQDWTLYDLQEQGVKDQLTGTWSLVFTHSRRGNNKLEPFGPNPQGLMILDGNGHFSIVITRPGPPKFTSNDGMEGNPEEKKAAAQGSIGYFGTYSISETDKTFNIHIEASTSPKYTGTDQKRPFTLTGDELK